MSLFHLTGFKPEDPLATPLLKIPGYGDFTVRDSHEGIGYMGIPGSGKTTGMNGFVNGCLLARYGCAALTVKPSAAEDFPRLVERAGRIADLHVLNGTNGERYNPFDDLASAADAAALLNELSSLVSGLSQVESASETFWVVERNRLLRHLCELCLSGHQRIDPQLLTDLLRGMPLTQSEYHDPQWREKSPVWRIIGRHREVGSNNLRQACDYVEFDLSRQEKRMQGSIIAMARSTLDQLLRDPLASIFSGKSTVTMSDVLERGQLIAVGLPALGSVDGRVANAIVQFCFCQRAKATKSARDSFFLSDECQETLTQELMSSLAVLREHRVCVILATQSIGTLNLRAGKEAGEALLSLMGTLFFLKQTHEESRRWATGRIGKMKKEVETITKNNGNKSVSYCEEWVDRVPERDFQQLEIGESIGVRGDKFWRCTWPKDGVSGWGEVSLPRPLRKQLQR